MEKSGKRQGEIKMTVIKRNKEQVRWQTEKVYKAIMAANKEVSFEIRMRMEDVKELSQEIKEKCKEFARPIEVEEIQDIVEEFLLKTNIAVARKYMNYRQKVKANRLLTEVEKKALAIIDIKNEELRTENLNKDVKLLSTQRDYMAGELSKSICRKTLWPKHIMAAHDLGKIHVHDLDFIAQKMHNCTTINVEDMLQNGTCISGVTIDSPKSFQTACTVVSQIIAQVASSQAGGQTVSLAHLAPFVEVSRKKFRRQVAKELAETGLTVTEEQVNRIAEMRLEKEVEAGMQTIQYQCVSIQSTNGQTPFVTLWTYLGECKSESEREDLAKMATYLFNQRILGIKNKKGVYISPSFPKLIYVLEESNMNPDGKYYYLTELAARCSAKRMVPDYVSEKIMKKVKVDSAGEGQCYPIMGCRAMLPTYRTPDTNQPKYYGRFNQGVCTLNLPHVALSSSKDMEAFWNILEERCELVKEALMLRHQRILGTPVEVAPILWQHGAISRMPDGAVVDDLLFNSYSSISFGFAGLSETVYHMTGKYPHLDEESRQFALDIMNYLNKKCADWREETKIGFSVLGSPIESVTYKFAKANQMEFGIVEHVTDKDYVTNSYHIPVTVPIDGFSKFTYEADFQAMTPAGSISYIEVPNMQHNIPALMKVIEHIYNTLIYAEINTKSDYCQICSFDGEIKVIKDEETDLLVWECPNCKNREEGKMNISRRTCGYLGDFGIYGGNQGRIAEIADRVLHL
jgi:ribonucleoside-triphosphate reductase